MNINKDDLNAPYASCVIMELYKNNDKEYYVEVNLFFNCFNLFIVFFFKYNSN